mmetsp:Transcript_36581/g.95773  ORF Transcript_36581/g.95773 Transcript_36581/m.95773 type:complete len:276 (+) Transcript_36581:70-897(+)
MSGPYLQGWAALTTPYAIGGDDDWPPPKPASAKPRMRPASQPPISAVHGTSPTQGPGGPADAVDSPPHRPGTTRWKPSGDKSSFRLVQMPGGDAIVTCEPDVKTRNKYTGISLRDVEEPSEEAKSALETFRLKRVPEAVLPRKSSFVAQDYPAPKVPASERPTRFFRGNGRQWGGQLSANFPLASHHGHLPDVTQAPTEKVPDRWATTTANTMAQPDPTAYKADRFSRKNRGLKIALSLKKAYASDDPEVRRKARSNRLPSLKMCQPGSFQPTFD